MPTLVYSYPCRVLSGEAEIGAQISSAHRYYNQLVELNRAFYGARLESTRKTCPDYDEAFAAVEIAQAKVDELRENIKRENARARRKRATPEESAALRAARADWKAARERRKEVRAIVASDPGLQVELGKIDIEFNGTPIEGSDRRRGGKFKEARAACGVYWGTYLKIEAAIEAAKTKTLGPLKFSRWDGSGQVAVQVQGGASVSDLLAGTGKIGNLIRWGGLTQRGKNRKPWLTLSMKVDGDTYATIRATLTRHLPDDARIMGVALVREPLPPHRTKDGWKPRYDWTIQFTVRTAQVKDRAKTGLAGVDLGWRLMEDGSLRVAYLVGDDGAREELRLPARLVSGWDKAKSIQSIRDRNFNSIIEAVANWKAEQTDLPEWFLEESKFMTAWRAKGKLARLLDRWEASRIACDALIVDRVRDWRSQDVHLWQWDVHQTKKCQRERLRLYRLFAARTRKRFAHVVVEDCDWRQIARKNAADDNQFDPSRWYMRIASIGKLRQLLVQDGALPQDSKDTTRTCNLCGSVEEWDQAKDLWHTCERCGAKWDQDENAAQNLLKLAVASKTADCAARESQTSGRAEVASDGSAYVGRWAKRKAARSQRLAESPPNQ